MAILSTIRVDDNTPKDMSQTRIRVVPYFFVVRAPLFNYDVLIPPNVERKGPENVEQHERWHTDGVSDAVAAAAKAKGYPARRGYREGAEVAIRRFRGDLLNFVLTQGRVAELTAADLRAKLAQLYDFYFVTHVDVMMAHGYWHAGKANGSKGPVYKYNTANDMNY